MISPAEEQGIKTLGALFFGGVIVALISVIIGFAYSEIKGTEWYKNWQEKRLIKKHMWKIMQDNQEEIDRRFTRLEKYLKIKEVYYPEEKKYFRVLPSCKCNETSI